MYTQFRPQTSYGIVMPVLNYNVIREENKKAAIQAMGLAACQAKCLRCSHCSDCKCGKRS